MITVIVVVVVLIMVLALALTGTHLVAGIALGTSSHDPVYHPLEVAIAFVFCTLKTNKQRPRTLPEKTRVLGRDFSLASSYFSLLLLALYHLNS